MNGTKWTAEEKKLLKTDMTTEQIAEATGRTEEAVRRARLRTQGTRSKKVKAKLRMKSACLKRSAIIEEYKRNRDFLIIVSSLEFGSEACDVY